jgi:hypothetical protein
MASDIVSALRMQHGLLFALRSLMSSWWWEWRNGLRYLPGLEDGGMALDIFWPWRFIYGVWPLLALSEDGDIAPSCPWEWRHHLWYPPGLRMETWIVVLLISRIENLLSFGLDNRDMASDIFLALRM